MQAIREKMNDKTAMREAKAELKEEEKAEKKMAKERLEVVHKIRLARDLHGNKAKQKVASHEAKYAGADDHDLHHIAYLQP